MIDNTTYRILVEKLGGSQANEFTGDEGELFYDPNIPELKLSDGSTVGGLTIAGGGAGGESYWVSGASGIHTLSNVGIGTTNPQYTLYVIGDAKISDIEISGTQILGSGTTTILGDIQLIPNYNLIGSGQYVKLRPTTAFQQSHIHIEAGEVNSADLYLGDDNRFVKIDRTGPVVIGVPSTSTTSNWTAISDEGPTNFILFDIIEYPWAEYITYGDTVTLPDTTVITIINTGPNGNNLNVYLESSISYLTSDILVFSYTPRTEWKFNSDSSAIFPGNLGIGTTNPTEKLDVIGDARITGAIFATTFVGDGTGLVGIVTDAVGTEIYEDGAARGTATQINFGNGFNVDPVTSSCANVSLADANNNFSVGGGSGGTYNNFLGFHAGYCNTTGNHNNFFGNYAGNCNTTGCNNNFFGDRAGCSNTTGCSNNFFGESAGQYNTTGFGNNFLGVGAGRHNTTGFGNNFLGYLAGCSNTIGIFNNFFGDVAGVNNTSGNGNNFFGNFIGISTSASNKIILGNGGLGLAALFDSPNTTKDTQFAVGIRTDANPANYWLVGNENFNIGIGTTNPTSKLHVGGDVKVGINTTQGVILTSPNGTAYRLIVANNGALSTVAV